MDVSRSLVTVLFTDIVGSTERAAELGDDAWGELLARHDGLVREALERCGGREVNTAGDGFLASFPDPDRAIHCACTLREAVHPLGLRIRAGLHVGEVERAGRAVGGIAVHIGARVAALAGADEVLVSSTVHDLVTGSGFGFEDRGEQELKGVPGRWRIWAVTSEPVRLPLRRPLRRLRDRLAPTRRHSITLGITVTSLVFGALGLHVVLQDRGRTLAPAVAVAESAAPGIAVLPFQVNGPELELLRQGMVDLLSTDLDGAAGLRAIDSRTVLARWSEHVRPTANADLETALRVARLAGGRYAIVGSAVAFGDGVRLSTEVYDVKSGSRLGRGHVDGPIDDMFGMVDRLAIEALRAILRGTETEPSGLGLASITTDSLEAMKAFLEGEVLFRRSDFQGATAAYERAVSHDRQFALAYYRLACAVGWSDFAAADEYLATAVRLAHRLPQRELLYVRGYLSWERGLLSALEPLERAVRIYPDDAEAWFLLGDAYFHLGAQARVPPEQSERALRAALALDPSFGPAYDHLVDAAFALRADSAETAEILQAYARVAGGTEGEIAARLAFAVAFGDEASRSRARGEIRAADPRKRLLVAFPLVHPRLRKVQEEILTAAPLPPDPRWAESVLGRLATSYFAQGRVREALEALQQPHAPVWLLASSLYATEALGLPAPPEHLADVLQSARPLQRNVVDFYAAAHAADAGRWTEHATAVGRVRGEAARHLAGGDSTAAAFFDAAADALAAHALWRRGAPDRALPLLEAAQRRATGLHERAAVNATIRHWIAELRIERGDLGDALQWLSVRETPSFRPGFPYEPYDALRVARLQKQAGNVQAMREAYAKVREAWPAPDAALEPALEEARSALAEAPRAALDTTATIQRGHVMNRGMATAPGEPADRRRAAS